MFKSEVPPQKESLVKLPKAYIYLYASMAIVIVIIPETIASVIIYIYNSYFYNNLKLRQYIGNDIPEIRLSSMKMRDLRLLASNLRIHGYARECRDSLSELILTKLKDDRYKRFLDKLD